MRRNLSEDVLLSLKPRNNMEKVRKNKKTGLITVIFFLIWCELPESYSGSGKNGPERRGLGRPVEETH